MCVISSLAKVLFAHLCVMSTDIDSEPTSENVPHAVQHEKSKIYSLDAFLHTDCVNIKSSESLCKAK